MSSGSLMSATFMPTTSAASRPRNLANAALASSTFMSRSASAIGARRVLEHAAEALFGKMGGRRHVRDP
jgi:hypothetical protein